jgi:hypothetical protein
LKFERGFSSFAIVVAVPLPDLHESLMDYVEVSLLLSHTVDPYLETHLNVRQKSPILLSKMTSI